MESNTIVLKVKNSTPSKEFGFSLAQIAKENKGNITVQVVGAGALNQATKGVIEANRCLASNGIQLISIPAFCDIEEGEKTITGIRLNIEVRR